MFKTNESYRGIVIKFFYFLYALITVQCTELFGPEYCRIIGRYEYYISPSGYRMVDDVIELDNFGVNCETGQKLTGYVINDSLTFISYIRDSICEAVDYYVNGDEIGYVNYANSLRLYSVLDFENRTLLVLSGLSEIYYSEAYWGGHVAKTFVCRNDIKQSVIVRCQYEIWGQCVGYNSEHQDNIVSALSVPKIPDDYRVYFEIVNTNPKD